MKNPMTLIREREANHPPFGNSIRLYTYVRPLKGGEATVEIWGARNDTRKKSRPLVCKKFFMFRTNRDGYKTRDALRYSSWSRMCHDHLCYSFPEAGGTDYYEVARHKYGGNLDEDRGVWFSNKASQTPAAFMPIAPMLNDWEGTKYKYCAYTSASGLSVPKYMSLYHISPKVELLSKAGLFNLLDEDICRIMAKYPRFGKFLAQHLDEARGWSVHAAKTRYAKTDVVCAGEMREARREAARLRALRATREERRRRREEAIRRKQEAERKRREEVSMRKRIRALYEQIKEVCGKYGAYEVIVPKSAAEMRREGRRMHNCIGKCYASKQGVSDICLFLHKNGKPCVDICVDLDTLKLVECRIVCNNAASEAQWRVAERIAKRVAAIIRKAA